MPVLELFEPSIDFTIQHAKKPVLLGVVSETCPHCHNMKPHLNALGDRFRGKVDSWILVAQRGGPRTAALAFDGVPALYGFHRGELLWRDVGFSDPGRLAAMYEALARRGTGQGW